MTDRIETMRCAVWRTEDGNRVAVGVSGLLDDNAAHAVSCRFLPMGADRTFSFAGEGGHAEFPYPDATEVVVDVDLGTPVKIDVPAGFGEDEAERGEIETAAFGSVAEDPTDTPLPDDGGANEAPPESVGEGDGLSDGGPDDVASGDGPRGVEPSPGDDGAGPSEEEVSSPSTEAAAPEPVADAVDEGDEQ